MNPIEVPEGLVEEQIKHMVIQALKKGTTDPKQNRTYQRRRNTCNRLTKERTQRKCHPTLTTGAGT